MLVMSVNDDPHGDDDNVNKLLIKCIDLRNQIASLGGDLLLKIVDPEEVVKSILREKCIEVVAERKEFLIEIELYVEKTSQPCLDAIHFECNPNWTIRTTKQKILDYVKIDSPLDHLLIVCQNIIAKDWLTLKQCGVDHDNNMLYVYVAQSDTSRNSSLKHITHSASLDELDNKVQRVSSSNTGSISKSATKSSAESQNFPAKILQSGMGNINFSNSCRKVTPEFSAKTPTSVFTVSYPSPNSKFGAFSYSVPVDDEQSSVGDGSEGDNKPSTSNGIKTLKERTLQRETVLSQLIVGWTCADCTYINEPTRPGCEICSSPRPSDYKPPENYVPTLDEQERMKKEKDSDKLILKMQKEMAKNEEINRQRSYRNYVSAHQQNLFENDELAECSICMSEANPGEGVKLADCLHVFCKECLSMHITLSDVLPVKCPYVDDNYDCTAHILEREIRSLLPDDKYQDYLRKSLNAAERHLKNTFHCKTADCHGWCEFDDGVNNFQCPVCNHINCLTCKAIHESMDCKEYQNLLFTESSTNKQAKKTKKLLTKLIKKKDAMHCPDCNIIILKKEGCDWLRCSMCQLEICWVTQQPRWGPNGIGDTSGGCRCRVNGQMCHPMCVNCH